MAAGLGSIQKRSFCGIIARQIATLNVVGEQNLGFPGDFLYIATGIPFVFASLNSFAWNRMWTFRHVTECRWSKLTRFYFSVGSGSIINIGVFIVFVELLGNGLLSVAIAVVSTAMWEFAWAKYFVFK